MQRPRALGCISLHIGPRSTVATLLQGLGVVHPPRPCFSPSVKGVVTRANETSSGSDSLEGKMDDEDYPAYSMGSAAQILATTPAFLRSLDEARLLTPQRSGVDIAATRATNCGSPPGCGS